jgi:hypothetical protein
VMEVIKTNIEGVVIIEPRIFKDVVISLNLFLKENLRKRFVKRLLFKIMKVSLAMEY